MNATIDYEPAESTTGMFGGNSNWRGPIWFPVNYLVVDALFRYARYFGDDLKLEYPTGSGERAHAGEIGEDIRRRLISLFLVGEDGRRPCFGWVDTLQTDPAWKDNILFNEYFHGDNGAGLGASHQTGWTGIVADMIRRSGGATILTLGELMTGLDGDAERMIAFGPAGLRQPRRGRGARVARRRRPRRLRDGHGRGAAHASLPRAARGRRRRAGQPDARASWRSTRCSSSAMRGTGSRPTNGATGSLDPRGHELLVSFELDDGVPRWRWQVGDVVARASSWRWRTAGPPSASSTGSSAATGRCGSS